MSLESSAGQLLDKLSDLVVGPVRGTITAAASPNIVALDGRVVVPQGLYATIPDGRVCRVVRGRRVGTTAVAVDVRLLHLAPTSPKAGNFQAVGAGLAATWVAGVGPDGPVSVPADLLATGTTTAFGYTSRAGVVRVGSVVEAAENDDAESNFRAGATGTVSLVVLEPDTKPIAGAGGGGFDQASEMRLQFREVTWKIRANLATSGTAKERRTFARRVHDNLVATVQGATIGDGQARVGSWRLVRRDPAADSWELVVTTYLYSEGRVLQPEAVAGLGRFEEFGETVTLPGDTAQPGPHRVVGDVTVANAFDDGFDDGHG